LFWWIDGLVDRWIDKLVGNWVCAMMVDGVVVDRGWIEQWML